MAKEISQLQSPVDSSFDSYAGITAGLLPDSNGICLLGADFQSRGHATHLSPAMIADWLRALGWHGAHKRIPAGFSYERGKFLSAIPLEDSEGRLLGVFCVLQRLDSTPLRPARHAAELAGRLKPLLDCVRRDFVATPSENDESGSLTELSAELDWLFQVTSARRGSADDKFLLREMLHQAARHLTSAYGVIAVPSKRLLIDYSPELHDRVPFRKVWRKTQKHLFAWAQRQNRPLVINSAGNGDNQMPACKILSVPLYRDSGQLLGVLAFYNPIAAANYAPRHAFLARHLGRQTASIVDCQFDLMTGLYTRTGLEQMCTGLVREEPREMRCILYIDIDHMHLVNDLHGFEVGNELIVRVAELLAPPLLPAGALAARVSGDRFAVVLPAHDPQAAAAVAARIQQAAHRLVIGPTDHPIDVLITCGVAAFVNMPQGFDRAIAAAELACKSAKSHGRGRVELYAREDSSMMRRHDDAVAVGQLRQALRSGRLLLFAQRIAPLKPSGLDGYELLLRLRAEDGSLVAPGPLIRAAQRYQLLPSIDLWVIQRTLELLAPFRGLLKTRNLSISINISGQSLCDEACMEQFKERLRQTRLPPGCLTVEITEQSAVRNLGQAHAAIAQLQALGCRFALDDFGTGTNSLAYLKNLQIGRVKIDGSFISDILTNRNSQATVKAIVELTRELSIETVAEYVETREIARAVQALGIDYAQGYAFGRPEPLEGLLERLDPAQPEEPQPRFIAI
jgi:diguanylate cyclase (GGDEF)-like protein